MPDSGSRPFGYEIFAALDDAILRGVTSSDELRAIASRTATRYNETPQRDLAGLSPNQLAAMLATDWVSPGAPVTLNQRLTPERLAPSPLFHNARTLLTSLRDEGPLGATATGNLNRKAVATLLPLLRLRPGALEEIHVMNKVINEPDVFVLYELRVALQGLGLIRRHKGFRVSRAGRELLSDTQAGRLFSMLFLAVVVSPPFEPRFALSPDAMYAALPFACWRLAACPDSWSTVTDLADTLWPPFVRDAIAETPWVLPPDETLRMETEFVLLRPLERAGLLELRPGTGALGASDAEFRRTPLFDAFFNFSPSLP
jgi:hypothetical protein